MMNAGHPVAVWGVARRSTSRTSPPGLEKAGRSHELLEGPDPVKKSAVMRAMLEMVKLDVAALQKAYDEAA